MTNEELVLAVQAGQDVTGNMARLYEQNKGMIYKLTEKYSGVEDPEDLRQECYFGLVQAVETWDPAREVSFISYAIPCMKTQMIRYISTCGTIIRIPSSRRALIAKYEKVENAFRRDLGRGPTPQELKILLHIDKEQLRQLRKDIRLLRIRSTAEVIGGEDDDLTLEDSIADARDEISDLIDRIQNEELSAALWSEVDALAPREAAVLRDRYQNGRTLKECGEALGCSYQNAKQLHDKALRSLRRGNHLKRLRPFLTDSGARSFGLKCGSLASFHASWSSSQEMALMMIEQRTGVSLWHGKEINLDTSIQ